MAKGILERGGVGVRGQGKREGYLKEKGNGRVSEIGETVPTFE